MHRGLPRLPRRQQAHRVRGVIGGGVTIRVSLHGQISLAPFHLLQGLYKGPSSAFRAQ